MAELVFNGILDGEALVKKHLDRSGHIIDDKGNRIYWGTIDKSKKYYVEEYESDRALQYYPVITYQIKERKKYSLFRRCEWSKKEMLVFEIYLDDLYKKMEMNIH